MKKAIRIILSISFIFYLFVLVYILFLGTRGYIWADLSLIQYIKQSSNFIPFKTISTYITAINDGRMNISIPLKNLVGNFILFLPMGMYLPFFLKKLNKPSIFLISMSALLLMIEILQLVTRRGSFDIDDFILNLLGTYIGFGIWNTKIVRKLWV